MDLMVEQFHPLQEYACNEKLLALKQNSTVREDQCQFEKMAEPLKILPDNMVEDRFEEIAELKMMSGYAVEGKIVIGLGSELRLKIGCENQWSWAKLQR